MTEPLSARAQNEPVSSAEEPGPGAGYVVRQRWRRLVGRREVVFAVHAGGVYFGSGRPPETVPWDLIRAVELFREMEPHLGPADTVFRCIGVRATGIRQVRRPGSGPAATPQTPQAVQYYVDWTVPEGQVWRNLHTIDFRIRGGKTALWVRWDEPSNLISLCQKTKDAKDDDEDDGLPKNVECTDGGLPGGTGILETDRARLRLAESSVVGSGPTGRDVTLGLLVEFLDKSEGHHYNVEVAATDDFGRVDRFERAAEVEVVKAKKHQ